MKLRFKEQQYQVDAVNALVRVFSGQTRGFRTEVVSRREVDANLFGSRIEIEEIFSNKKLEIVQSEVLKNVQELQREQGIPVVPTLQSGFNFTVEMETGTGKTYVYTRAMLELHKQYGWNKYIIMVPSVAIREGVHKSLQITQEHFQELYGKKIRFFIYDTKNKSNITNIQKFGSSSDIEVIIMNYQAFGRRGQEALKMFQQLDVIQSQKPIDVIKRVRPILIIDEPQRFGATAEAMLGEFDPLWIVRFSATHKADYNKIYRLDAIDAYNQKLVKKIKVKGIEISTNLGTSGYMFLERINVRPDKNPTATIEIEINQSKTIAKHIRTVSEGANIYELSGGLAQYQGYTVREINARTGMVSFTNGESLSVGQMANDPYELHLRRVQIRETIKSHIEKERELFSRGIKVLSLFFIDEVSKYRAYDETGNQIKSEYEQIFEEEYVKAIEERTLFHDEYNQYLSKHAVTDVHNGYFSIDKKGRAVNSSEPRGEGGSDDVSAYDLIMKNKERLLSFEEPTRFIFSHSALREGWDNPNIFQICTLKHSDSTISKRQEIGRGLRIAVNQYGERMDQDTLGSEFFGVNSLTVVASESYDSFSKQLQKEILDSLSGRPTKLVASVLIGRQLINSDGKRFTFDETAATNLIFEFRQKGYLKGDFTIDETMMQAIDSDTFTVPAELSEHAPQIVELMQGMYATATYNSADNDLGNSLPKVLAPNENFVKKEFQDLWGKIKAKTAYTVQFDTSELIEKSVAVIDRELEVKQVTVRIVAGEQVGDMTESGLQAGNTLHRGFNSISVESSLLGNVVYDLVAEVAKGAHITRKTAATILSKIQSHRFNNFKVNPEDFIKQISRIINEQKASTFINNIVYHKLDDSYDDEIFTINDFGGVLEKDIIEVKKHIYDYIKTDSTVEQAFARSLENAEGEVVVYAKLPGGFKIPTPVGSYNPDWAIVFDSQNVKHVYFIAETKGSMSSMQLKKSESLKIEYARKHFALLESDNIKYDVVTTYEDLRNKVLSS